MRLPTRKVRPLIRRTAVSASVATVVLGWPGGLMETRMSSQPAWGSQVQLHLALSGLSRGTTTEGARRRSRWRSVSTGNRELDGIACPSTRVCYAFGGTRHSAATWRTTIFETKDAGATWQARAIQPGGIPDRKSVV